jgi:hypothetical protein
MRDALNKKFGGAPTNATPVIKETLETINKDNSKPIVPTAQSSNTRKN